MKTRIISHRNSCYELIVDNGKNAPRQVLASMTLFEGTGAWMLTDIRLDPYETAHECSGGLSSDDISARYKPKDEKEAALVRSILHTYTEDEAGIRWSTYAGLVIGTPRDGAGLSKKNHIGYFTRDEGRAHLKELQAWWAAYEGDPDLAKIENPLLQPSSSRVISELARRKLVEDGVTPPDVPHPTPLTKVSA
jgi:hypothetical protein